jgi:hypothetical protein
LEQKRRCGWLGVDAPPMQRLVWARRNVGLDRCPKPYITAESQSLVEEFFIRRRFRGFPANQLSARQVEAFVILEKELTAEVEDGRRSRSRY